MVKKMAEQKKKKKISWNRVGLFLLIGVILANLYIWRSRTAGAAEIISMNNEVAVVNQQVDAYKVPPADLESRLKKLKADLAAAQKGFPATVDRNAVIDYILKTAEKCEVAILPLASEGWKAESIGQSYNVLSITAIAEGSMAKVKEFLIELQSGPYPTLTIPGCDIRRTGVPVIAETEDEMQVQAGLRISIYTCLPSPEEDAAS